MRLPEGSLFSRTNEHLPRIRRSIEAVAKAALNAGASRAAVAELRQRLLAFAEDEYMKRWRIFMKTKILMKCVGTG